MVSQPQNYGTAPVTGSVASDRGIRESTVVSPALTGERADLYPQFSYFWGSVISGTLVAMTFSIMSYALMFGCRVGVSSDGSISLTWPSAVWIVVTTCLSYFLGGFVASRISRTDIGYLRGLAVWGLSLPLTLVIVSVIAAGLGVAYGLNGLGGTAGPAAAGGATASNNLITNNFVMLRIFSGSAWTVFVSLVLGCVFAIIGGMMTPQNRARIEERRVM